jgi:DNA-directed RNA polymerase subunit omega
LRTDVHADFALGDVTPSTSKDIAMADKQTGIIDPPIDELLSKVDSKYALVIFASKRARQINDYYADLHEGSLFDNVGPLVDSTIDDKPLSVALREINDDRLVLTSLIEE